MWLLRCGIFAPTRWKPCSYCVASFCGSTGTPKSPAIKETQQMDYQYTEHTNVQSYSNHSVIPDHVLSNPSRFPIVVGDFAYVRLTRGKWAIIDKSSVIAVESIGIWYANRGPSGEWYALRGDRGSRYTRMHRLVFETTNGPIPSGMEIDHIHGTNINPIL